MKLSTRIFRRDDWYVTSKFGWRISPISGKQAFHNGTDYGTHVSKWNQYALEDGSVLNAGKDNSGAIFAWVRYPRLGIDLLHYHLDKVFVKTGQKVNKDTVIGTTGTTGYSTGIHLHLGLRNSGSNIDLDPHAYDYQEPPKPTPAPKAVSRKYKVGDTVVINGTLHGNSFGGNPGMKVSNLKKKIQLVNNDANSTHPYNFEGYLGWVKESDISLPVVQNNSELKVGDRVKIVGYGNGNSFGTANTAGGIGLIRTVMAIYPGRKFPYQIGLGGVTTGFYPKSSLAK